MNALTLLKTIDDLTRKQTRQGLHGETIEDFFHWDFNRYFFDERLDFKEWRQFDTEQDAWYFGIWVSATHRQILVYAEGDIELSTFKCLESFFDEIKKSRAFYGEAPPEFVAYDLEAGTRTEYYSKDISIEDCQ